ncbi:unnamed protein product, partial [Mesorhabditis spiculigera]
MNRRYELMMRLPLFLIFAATANCYVSPHWYTQCFRRVLKVGDIITIKGHVITGATRWTCNIAESEMNNIIIHADHRIHPTPAEGAWGTHVNARPGMGAWNYDAGHGAIPFAGGPFEFTFRILDPMTVEIYYKNATWTGTSYRRPSIALESSRQIDCNGDVLDVTFHGDMMRDKVLPVKSRSDCLVLPKEKPPRRHDSRDDHRHSHDDHYHHHHGSDSQSSEEWPKKDENGQQGKDAWDAYNIEVPDGWKN